MTQDLFTLVMFHDSAIESTLRDLIRQFTLDKISVLTELVNFILSCSGVKQGQVDSTLVQDVDSISNTLVDLIHSFDPDVQDGYPLLPKKRGKAHLKFKKNLKEFWTKFIHKSCKNGLLDEDARVLEVLYQWLGAMSSSAFKPFRHTSTFIALCIHSALCELNKEFTNLSLSVHSMNNTLVDESMDESADESTPSKRVASKSKRVSTLNVQVQEATLNKALIETQLSNIFDGIFINRYRDSDPLIRCECILQLCEWAEKYPEKYMDPQYTRYIGWMLADLDPSVRLACVGCCTSLYTQGNLDSMRLFTDRFKSRLVSMASTDVDFSIRVAATQTLVRLDDLDLLNEELQDKIKICHLMFDEDAKIRENMAPVLMKLWQEEVESMNDSPKEAMSTSDPIEDESMSQDFPRQLKGLISLLLKYTTSHPCIQEFQELKSQESLYKSLFDEDDLSFEEEEIYKSALQDQLEIVQQVSSQVLPSSPWISLKEFKCLEMFVDSMWNYLDFLQDYETLSSCLLDPSINMEIQGFDKQMIDKTCLYLLNGSIQATLKYSKQYKKNSKTSNVRENEIPSLVSHSLANICPLLFTKFNTYSGDLHPLILSIHLLVHLDLNTFAELRLSLDELLGLLNDLYSKHSHSLVLQEIAMVYKCFSEQSHSPLTLFVIEKKNELSLEIFNCQVVNGYTRLARVLEEHGDSLHDSEEDSTLVVDSFVSLELGLRRLLGLIHYLNISCQDLGLVDSFLEFMIQINDLCLTCANGLVDGNVKNVSCRVMELDLELILNYLLQNLISNDEFNPDSAGDNDSVESIHVKESLDSFSVNVDESEESNSPSPSTLGLKPKQEPGTKGLVQSINKFIEILQALLTCQDSQQLELDLNLRLKSLKILTVLYTCLNGKNVLFTRESIEIIPPELVQEKMMDCMERFVLSVGVLDLSLSESASASESTSESESEEVTSDKESKDKIDSIKARVRHEGFKLLSDFAILINMNVLNPKYSILFTKYYGLNQVDSLLFGKEWDEICKNVLTKVFLEQLRMQYESLSLEQNTNQHEFILSMTDVLQVPISIAINGLNQSLELYYSGLVSLDSSKQCLDLLMNYMRKWTRIFSQSKTLLYPCLKSALLNGLSHSCLVMVQRMEIYSKNESKNLKNKRLSMMSDLSFLNPPLPSSRLGLDHTRSYEVDQVSCKLKEWTLINQGWSIWNQFTLFIKTLLHGFNPKDEDLNESLDELYQNILQSCLDAGCLSGLNLTHPNETSMDSLLNEFVNQEDWSDFIHFLKSCKSTSNPIKKKKKRTMKSNSNGKNGSIQKEKEAVIRRSSRRILNQELPSLPTFHDNEEEDDDDSLEENEENEIPQEHGGEGDWSDLGLSPIVKRKSIQEDLESNDGLLDFASSPPPLAASKKMRI